MFGKDQTTIFGVKRNLLSQENCDPNVPQKTVQKPSICTRPEKTLDAPGILDDYYLNLLDWSSDSVIAIALNESVYLQETETGQI